MKKIIEVTWKDHFSETGWKDEDELSEWLTNRRGKRCTSVGQIAYEDDEILVLASSDDGEDSLGDFMAIYKNHITKRKVIRK